MPPAQPPDPSAELQGIFQEEVLDWLGSLEGALATLARPAATATEQLDALTQIRRGAHTLKGAAGAMDVQEVQQLCHTLEDRLPPPEPPVDAARVVAVTEDAIARLREWLTRQGRTAPSPATEEAPAPPLPDPESGTVRVPSDRLAEVFTLSEELLTVTTRGHRQATSFEAFDEAIASLRARLRGPERTTAADLRAARAALDSLATWAVQRRQEQRALWSALLSVSSQVGAATRALRAVRFRTLVPVLERAVQQASAELGRQAELVVVGEQEQLDRQVAEQLRVALVHLLRNAVDHGIEPPDVRTSRGKPPTGRVEVRAQTHGTEVTLTVSDDGQGVDMDALRQLAEARGIPLHSADAVLDLLFEPNVTTRTNATTTSGRGIGLDVVRQVATALQGRVEVDPGPGRGARFHLTVAANLGVAQGAVVTLAGRPYVIRGAAIQRFLRIPPEERQVLEGRAHTRVEDALLPIVDARRLLSLDADPLPADRPWPALLLAAGNRRVALVVEALGEMREIVVKPLGPRVKGAGFVTGVTLLEGGQVTCVLDASLLARFGRAPSLGSEAGPRPPSPRVLVVDDSVTTRQLLASILRTAGYRVELAADGDEAWRLLTRQQPPDLVVSDIEMPHVDGFQLLSRVRSSPQTADLPVILVTARAEDADRRRALELGADAYIVKGRFDQANLLDAIAEMLP